MELLFLTPIFFLSLTVVLISLRYNYVLKKCDLYNKGYHSGCRDRLKETIYMSEKANQDLCSKFSAQFSGSLEGNHISSCIEHTVGINPINGSVNKFYGETYTISFYIEPNRGGYATLSNIKQKEKNE